MTGKSISKNKMLSPRFLTDLLRTAVVLLLPLVLTAMLSMLRLLTEGQVSSDGWDVCCFLLTALAWAGAVVCTKTRLLGKPMPKTGLVLAAILLFSVLMYVLAFAIEQEVLSYHGGLWALGRFFGSPAAVSVDGIRTLSGGIMEGAAAMLTCGVYLAISLAAAIPATGRKGKK